MVALLDILNRHRDHKSFTRSHGGPERPWTEFQDRVDRAIRLWNFGLLVNGMEKYKDAEKFLQKAVEVYGSALRSSDTYQCYNSWTGVDEDALRVMGGLVDTKIGNGQVGSSEWPRGRCGATLARHRYCWLQNKATRLLLS